MQQIVEDIIKKTGQNIGNITVSLGVSVINFADTIDGFTERADKALYHAKKSGRNIVITERKFFNPAKKTNSGIDSGYSGYEATSAG